jgi:hemoglobin-like flavoprotein
MDAGNIDVVRGSWQKVLPIRDTAAQLFYGRLFELDPSLRGLFKGDMVEQGRKLMAMLDVVVDSLDGPDPVLERIEELGRRHVRYGAKEAHYDTVGAALIWTLGQGLGGDFTPAVEGAWVEAYTTLATAMKRAASSAA